MRKEIMERKRKRYIECKPEREDREKVADSNKRN